MSDDIAEFLATTTAKIRKSMPTSVMLDGQVRPLVELSVAEIKKVIEQRRREADAIQAWFDWRGARYQEARAKKQRERA
jgi:hypothetical protein